MEAEREKDKTAERSREERMRPLLESGRAGCKVRPVGWSLVTGQNGAGRARHVLRSLLRQPRVARD